MSRDSGDIHYTIKSTVYLMIEDPVVYELETFFFLIKANPRSSIPHRFLLSACQRIQTYQEIYSKNPDRCNLRMSHKSLGRKYTPVNMWSSSMIIKTQIVASSIRNYETKPALEEAKIIKLLKPIFQNCYELIFKTFGFCFIELSLNLANCN